MKKTALITNITGQDGSYLSESLLEKGMRYTVSSDNPAHLIPHGFTTSIRIPASTVSHFFFTIGTGLIQQTWPSFSID